jgi:hypothetical protein
MQSNKSCPLCGKTKTCEIDADGQSGYCNTEGKKWEFQLAKVSDLKPGPIRHQELPEFLLDIMQWSFKVIGHYVVATLEQWELDFMRDLNVGPEVLLWHRIAFAFITYHRKRNLPVRSDSEEQQLVGSLVSIASGVAVKNTKESGFIQQCYEAPDSWDEEITRVKSLAASRDARWSPPEQFKDWPEKL